jgi:hypothetical protein
MSLDDAHARLVAETEMATTRLCMGLHLCGLAHGDPYSRIQLQILLTTLGDVRHENCRSARAAAYIAGQVMHGNEQLDSARMGAEAIHCWPEAHC